MKKILLLLALNVLGLSAWAFPSYEPFTEFGPKVVANGSNLVCVVANHVMTVGTTGPTGSNNVVGPYDTYLTNVLDFSSGGLADPMGEAWTVMRFGGTNTSVSTANAVSTNWIHGLDVSIINDTVGALFPNSSISPLLPSTFPGYPAAGAAITNMIENAAQPPVWNGSALVQSPNIVGNSAVLNLSQDITRPASGTKVVYVSYLLRVAQIGAAGPNNYGRYLAFVAQTNLNAGPGSVNSYPSWNSMFNTFNTTTAARLACHGVLQTNSTSLALVPCDDSAGKSTASATFTTPLGTPVFVVGAYAFHATNNPSAADTNAMWVNPATSSFGGSAAPSQAQVDLVGTSSQLSDIAGLIFIDRVGNGASGGIGTNYIANLLVGTTWSYVTGGPEFTNQPVVTTNVNLGQTVSLTGQATAAAQSVTYRWQKISGSTTNLLTDGSGTAGGTGTVSGSATPTLTITGISGNDIGNFQLVATASGTAYFLGSSITTLGLSDPQIVANPAGTNVNYGGTATFTAHVITANGPLQYRWFLGTTPLNNGVQPDGSTASGASGTTAAGTNFNLTLTLSGVSYQDIGGYSLNVTNTLGLFGSTAPGVLTVSDPYIVTQPASPAVADGGNAIFTVAASGSATLGYQWYEGTTALNNGGTTVGGSAVVSGAQGPTLTLTDVQDADNGSYYCAVTSSASGQSTNSTAVSLTVQDPLTVVGVPQSRTERAGDHLAFSVTVTGGGPQFQWQYNGNPIAGATNAALVFTNLQPASGGTYSVVVQNAATSSQTYAATLTVINSTLLPLYSTNILVARVGDGVQKLSGATGNTLYLDQYTPGGVYVSTVQVPDETAGAPYGSGSSASVFGSPALIFPGAGNDTANAALLTGSGQSGQYLDLAGYCENYPFSGSDVTVGTLGGADWRGLATINAFGVYSLAYTNTGFYSGGNHSIRAMVTLDGTNFWATGQASSAGVKFANSTVTNYATGNLIPTISSSDTGTRVVQIVNGNLMFADAGGSPGIYLCAGTPEPAQNANASSTQLIAEGSAPVDFAVSPDQNTIYISDSQGFSGTNSQGGGIERWDTNSVSGGYMFSYTLPVDPSQTLGAAGLAVNFSASTTWGPGVTGAVLYATTYGNASNSLVTITDLGTSSTPTVLLTAGANNALRGVRFGPAAVVPFITAAPQSQTNFPGNSVTFSVAAGGSAPLSYQWYGPAGLITGATNTSLTVSGISLGSAGGYYAVVSNPTGTNATSPVASLAVTAGAPTLSPVSLPNYKETVGDHLALATTVNGTLPITYSWYKNGNSTPVLTGTITNLGANASGLSLANIQIATAGTYKLVVSNIYGSASNTSGGILTVTTARQTLSANNLVVARIGDGVQLLSGATGNTLYLDQYTPAGSYVNTIQIPDEGVGQAYGTGSTASTNLPAGSEALLFAGSGADAPYEGFLTLAPNGQDLSLAGYCEAYPASGADVTSGANGGPNWRGVATIDAYGYYSLNYTNTGLYSEGLHQIHSAVDLDGNGTNFYTTGQAGGGNGVKYCNVDKELASGSGIVSLGGSFSGTRIVQVINGNVVFSDVGANPAGIYGFSGLPISAGSATSLIPETNSPVDFAASPDGNTVYIADNGVFGGTGSAAGGIERWDGTFPNNYTYSYTLPVETNSTAGARGLVVDFSAQSTWGAGVTGAKLYVTTAEPAGNRLVAIVDNGAASVPTTLVSAGSAQTLSGVRFGPVVVPPAFASQPQPTNAFPGASVTLSAQALGSGPLTYQWYFQAGGTGAFNAVNGATNALFTIGSVTSGNVGNYYLITTSPSGATSQSQAAALNLASLPQFTAETNPGPGQGFQLSFTGPAGYSYTIWGTSDLTLRPIASTWTQLETGLTFSGGTDGFTDYNNANNTNQFYIITVP